jgi:hypothetical protein
MPLSETTAYPGRPFTLANVPNGEGTLEAYKRGENFRTVRISRPITVNGQSAPIRLEVPSGDSAVEGQIALGGRLPETLRITVQYDLDGSELSHMALGRFDGAFELLDLPSGTATIEIEATMQDGQVFTETSTMTFEPGQVTQADFVVPE